MVQFEELMLSLQALKPDIDDLSDALGMKSMRSEIEQLELRATEPGFWDNVEKSQQILQKTGALKGKVEAYEALVAKYEDTVALIELADEEEDLSTTKAHRRKKMSPRWSTIPSLKSALSALTECLTV